MPVTIETLADDKVTFEPRAESVHIQFPCGQKWHIAADKLIALCARGKFAAERAMKIPKPEPLEKKQ